MIIKLIEQEIGIVDTGKFYKIIKVRIKIVNWKIFFQFTVFLKINKNYKIIANKI